MALTARSRVLGTTHRQRGPQLRPLSSWTVALALLALILVSVGWSFPRSAMGEATVLRNGAIEVHVLHRGAIIQTLRVPDRGGNVADVVLGFDTEEPYKVH